VFEGLENEVTTAGTTSGSSVSECETSGVTLREKRLQPINEDDSSSALHVKTEKNITTGTGGRSGTVSACSSGRVSDYSSDDELSRCRTFDSMQGFDDDVSCGSNECIGEWSIHATCMCMYAYVCMHVCTCVWLIVFNLR
jgi:hypothetical protein